MTILKFLIDREAPRKFITSIRKRIARELVELHHKDNSNPKECTVELKFRYVLNPRPRLAHMDYDIYAFELGDEAIYVLVQKSTLYIVAWRYKSGVEWAPWFFLKIDDEYKGASDPIDYAKVYVSCLDSDMKFCKKAEVDILENLKSWGTLPERDDIEDCEEITTSYYSMKKFDPDQEERPMGRDTLIGAFKMLRPTKEGEEWVQPSSELIASGINVLIMYLSESARIEAILEFLDKHYSDSEKIPSQYFQFIFNWKRVSNGVYQYLYGLGMDRVRLPKTKHAPVRYFDLSSQEDEYAVFRHRTKSDVMKYMSKVFYKS